MAQILVVDDEREACKNLKKILGKKGYLAFEAYNGEEALDILSKRSIEVVLLDIRMPVMNGIEALRIIKQDYPDTEVIMTTAISGVKVATECMKTGAYTYITKPIDVDSMLLEIERALERRKLFIENREYHNELEKRVKERTKKVHQLYKLLEESFFQSVRMFLDSIELYDQFLGGHSKRVAVVSRKLGESFHMDNKRIDDLEIAGFLHDIGTLGIPDRIRYSLYDELFEEEIKLVKQQTIMSQKVLETIERFNNPGKIIRSHLERVGGGGFPDGLKGDKISLESKILGVVNAYDEMKYRGRFFTTEQLQYKSKDDLAILQLKQQAGRAFDRKVVDRLLEILEKEELSRKKAITVRLHELRPGMVLAETLKAENGKKLLAAGNVISPILISKIINYNSHVSAISGKIYVHLT